MKLHFDTYLWRNYMVENGESAKKEEEKSVESVVGAVVEICGRKLKDGKLHLDETSVKNEDLAVLKGNLDIRKLWLNDTKISDEGLKHLSGLNELERLYLSYTEISDEGLKYLSGLTELIKLGLEGTKVTKIGVEKLQKALPNCYISWDRK